MIEKSDREINILLEQWMERKETVKETSKKKNG